jgi:hypothetical protein
MFAVFTGSQFGRGLGVEKSTISPLSARLANYRRQRARKVMSGIASQALSL